MDEKKNSVHIGENVVDDDVKLVINEEIQAILKLIITTFSQSLKAKIPELPEKIEQKIKEITEKPEIVDELSEVWSRELYKKGLIPKGYSGLPDELLISNFHQDGYLDGLYAGYVLAMMSLVGKNDFKVSSVALQKIIRKWIFMSTITGFYTGSTESEVEKQFADLRDIHNANEFVAYLDLFFFIVFNICFEMLQIAQSNLADGTVSRMYVSDLHYLVAFERYRNIIRSVQIAA